MPSLIDAETMWKCETCFHHRTGKCDPSIWCENGECYRPDMSKLRVLSLDEVKNLIACSAVGLTPEELDTVRSLERGDPVISPAVTLFGKPLEHWKELHIAELQGRLRVFPLSYWEGYTCSQFMGYDDVGEPKWRDGHFYVCHNHKCRYRTVIQSNYCPNCGAAMKEHKNETES